MSEITAINSPMFNFFSKWITYSQKVSKEFWENVNTIENQDRTTTRLIEKKMDFLTFNLERMIDLPKIKNFNRTEATSIALGLDRIREMFWTLEKSELKQVLETLEVLRK